MAKPARRLPDDTQPRIRILVEQSQPDPDRPRLDPELERRFARVDAEAAACYASMEETTFRLGRLAGEEDEGRVWPPDED